MAKRMIFKMTSGLNNAIEPHLLKYGEDGGCPLASCSNVFVDHSGGVRVRKPKKKVFDSPVHSFWSHGNFAFFCSDGKLYRLMPNRTTPLVSSAVGNEKLSFSFYMDRVYICNSTLKIVVDEENVYPWTENLPQQASTDTRILGFPGSFSRSLVHAGRICLIDGDELWVGEPFYSACFDMAAGPLGFGTDISAAISVESGLYVSNALTTFFIEGGGRRDFKSMSKVCSCPIIGGTEVLSSASELGLEGAAGMAAVWVCQDGVYVGTPRGEVVNLTEGRLVFPKILSGTACIHDGYYIFSLEVE